MIALSVWRFPMSYPLDTLSHKVFVRRPIEDVSAAICTVEGTEHMRAAGPFALIARDKFSERIEK